jgi:RNA polymerase sigma-70 factor, ECF subfamily
MAAAVYGQPGPEPVERPDQLPTALSDRYLRPQPDALRERVLHMAAKAAGSDAPWTHAGAATRFYRHEERALRQEHEFADFYQANYGKITAVVAAVLGDRHEAEDAAQEAFARALARWPRLARYELPEAWVRRVAVRLAIDHCRRLRRTARLTAKLLGARRRQEPESADLLPFTAMGRALLQLPLHEREAVVLHYLADLPVEQIARESGIPSGTVKGRLAAGRRRLERELAEHRDPEHRDPEHREGARDAR